MARQPNWSATRPLIVRDSRMPISTPEAMVPTTRPRVGRVGQLTGQRDEELGADGGQTDQQQRGEQNRPGGCHGGPGQGQPGRGQHDRDEPAPVQQVPERHQQEDPDGVADLGDGDQQPGHRGGHAEGGGDLLQQRLRPVQVADRGAAGHGEQQRHRPRSCRRGDPLVGGVGGR